MVSKGVVECQKSINIYNIDLSVSPYVRRLLVSCPMSQKYLSNSICASLLVIKEGKLGESRQGRGWLKGVHYLNKICMDLIIYPLSERQFLIGHYLVRRNMALAYHKWKYNCIWTRTPATVHYYVTMFVLRRNMVDTSRSYFL